MSDTPAEAVAHRREGRIVARYEGDHTPSGVVEGTEEAMVQLAEELLAAADRGESTDVEEWEENTEGFHIDVPEKKLELWSSEERTAFFDQFIGRRTQWYCQECTTAPMRSLDKARRHMEKQHGRKLPKKHIPTEVLES